MVCLQSKLLVCTFFLLLLTLKGESVRKLPCEQMNFYAVTHDGNDSKECYSDPKKKPCLTLSYLFSNIQQKVCVNISISNSHNISKERIVISEAKNWVISGDPDLASVHCEDQGGMVFENSSNVRLENMHFVNCTTIHNYSTRSIDYPLKESSALYFYQGNDVSIIGCTFSSAAGTGVILNNVDGNNLVSNTDFTDNGLGSNSSVNLTSGGLIVRQDIDFKNSSYTIDGCNFVENANSHECQPVGEDMVEIGAGATFIITISSHIIISNSNFVNNSGCEGGGVNIFQRGGGSLLHIFNRTLHINVSNSNFTQNSAAHRGGGMFVKVGTVALLKISTKLTIFSSQFSENSAEYGGGLNVDVNSELQNVITLTAINTIWESNKASRSGFAVGLSSLSVTAARPNHQTHFSLFATFGGCIFQSNQYYDSPLAYGAVHLQAAKAKFTNSTNFMENKGTALYLLDFSYATFSGNTVFNNNTLVCLSVCMYVCHA